MRLPNFDRAYVDMRKLAEYCLSRNHPRGRHKARVFEAALGVTVANAHLLREALLAAACRDGAVAADADEFGQRYIVDFPMQGPSGAATVRSTWIVRTEEDFPRLTSCFVL